MKIILLLLLVAFIKGAPAPVENDSVEVKEHIPDSNENTKTENNINFANVDPGPAKVRSGEKKKLGTINLSYIFVSVSAETILF